MMMAHPSSHRYRVMSVATVIVVIGVGLLYEDYARRHSVLTLSQLLTMPLKAGGPSAPLHPLVQSSTKGTAETQIPLTGGSQVRAPHQDGGLDEDAAPAVQGGAAPSALNDGTKPAAPVVVVSAERSTSQPRPNPRAVAEHERLPTEPSPDAPPRLAQPAEQPSTESKPMARVPANRPAAGRSETPGPFAMQSGVVVANGRQAPVLAVALNAGEIKQLMAARRVVAFAENAQGEALGFLTAPAAQFQPITELGIDAVSDRYLTVDDPGLISRWSMMSRCLSPAVPTRFGLRFTARFDAEIASAQMASLKAQGIDFDRALAQGHAVVTHGHFDEALVFVVDRVTEH